MIKTLSLKETGIILKIKKNDTVKKRLKELGVEIYKDLGGKEPYIICTEFEKARYNKFIKKLQREYPKTWREVFIAHQNNDIIGLFEFDMASNYPTAKGKYKPVGTIEKSIQEDWNKNKAA